MRNFFYRITGALSRFMYGRNGPDQLNLALLAVCVVLAVLRVPFSTRSVPWRVLDALSWVLLVVYMFRLFSKDLDRRRAENARFLSWWQPVSSRVTGAWRRRRDKDHKYFTCKNCGAICRVPAGKGRIRITCPKCGSQIEGKS